MIYSTWCYCDMHVHMQCMCTCSAKACLENFAVSTWHAVNLSVVLHAMLTCWRLSLRIFTHPQTVPICMLLIRVYFHKTPNIFKTVTQRTFGTAAAPRRQASLTAGIVTPRTVDNDCLGKLTRPASSKHLCRELVAR